MGSIGTRVATLLRTHTWALNLLFIALGAYFVAGAASSVLARGIRAVPSLDAAPERRASASGMNHVPQQLTRIAERNLFGAKRENLSPVPAAAQADTLAGATFSESQLKPCSLSGMSVRAALVADGAPEWSMAVVVVNNEPQVYSINQGQNELAADATVVDIRDRAIVVRRSDHFELCSCDEDGKAGPTFASTVSASSEPSGDGVVKTGETSFTLERSEVNKAFDNLAQVATQARIVPSFKNGKPNGFKLFSIKPGSIYSKIGLQNGDVIQKINGYEITSPDKALEVYQKLKDASNVTIDMQRRGQPITHTYSVE